MPNEGRWQDTLLSAAEARGISLSAVDIEIIRGSDEHSPLAKWVKTTLTSRNLLSEEELAIWKHVEHKRPNAAAAQGEVLAPTVPHDKDGMEQAIAFFEESTAAIEAHHNVIQAQQSCLNAYRERSGGGGDGDATLFERSLQGKRESEAQQLRFVNSDIRTEVESKLNLVQEKADKALKSLPSMITERLNSDDRILEDLQQSLHEGVAGVETDVSAQKEHIDNLLPALRNALTLSLKDRLDRIYLQELTRPTHSDFEHHDEVSEQEISQLKDDLEILYAEIDDVAAMLIQHEHGHRLDKTLQILAIDNARQQAENRRKVHDKLSHMTQDLNDLAQRYESLRSHRIVVQHMQAYLARIIEETPRKAPISSSISTSPSKIRDNKEKGHNYNYSHGPTGPALTALLQHLNIDSTSSTTTTTTTTASASTNQPGGKTTASRPPSSRLDHATTKLKQDTARMIHDIHSSTNRATMQYTHDMNVLSNTLMTGQQSDISSSSSSSTKKEEREKASSSLTSDTMLLYGDQVELIDKLDRATMKVKNDVERVNDDEKQNSLARSAFIEKWKS